MSLEDIEKIKRLKAKYFRLLDLHEWEQLGRCFTEDVKIVVERNPGEVGFNFQGRDEFIKGVSGILDKVSHVHHGHMPEIDIIDAANATGIWAMHDRLIYPDRLVNGWGHYHETYVREGDGEWRISSLRLTRLRYEVSPL
jgi:hypothetical protein